MTSAKSLSDIAAGASATAARKSSIPAMWSPARSFSSPSAARALASSSCALSVCGESGFALTKAVRRSTRAAASSFKTSSSSAFKASSSAGFDAAGFAFPDCGAGLRCA